jgi:hypothetical protein
MLSRRDALRGGAATMAAIAVGGAVAAAVPAVVNANTRSLLPALDPEALEVARVFMLIPSDESRAALHQGARFCAKLDGDPSLSARIRPLSAWLKGAES